MTFTETKSFDTLNYEFSRPCPKGKNKKINGLMKDELGGKIKAKLVWLRTRTYSCLIDGGGEDKKEKGTKKHQKRKLKCKNYKDYLEATQLEKKIKQLQINWIYRDKGCIKNNKLILKAQQRFRSKRHNVFTEEILKLSYVQMMIKVHNQLVW